MYQLDVLRRIAARHRNDGRPQVLHPIVQPQSAGKQTVTVRHRKDVVAVGPESAQAAGDHLRPDGQIAAGIAYHGGRARRTRRGVQAHDLRHRNGEKPVRIVIPKVLLGGKRQLDDIVHRPDIVRRHVHLLHFAAVKRRIVIDSLDELMQAFSLEGAHLLASHTLFGLVPDHGFRLFPTYFNLFRMFTVQFACAPHYSGGPSVFSKTPYNNHSQRLMIQAECPQAVV